MANTYKNIVITPNRDTDAANVPSIRFSGGDGTSNTDINLRVYTTQSGTLSFEGSAGQLFSVTNDLSGSIFSVNDVSGIPSIEVFANGQISFAPYGGNVVFGSTSSISNPYFNSDINFTNASVTRFISTPANNSLTLRFGTVGQSGYGTRDMALSVQGGGYVRVDYSGSGTYQYDPYGSYWHMGYSGIIFNNSGGNAAASPVTFQGVNYVNATTSFRAPIFYDSDNTAYYMDLNSTSRLNVLQFASGATNGPYFNYGNNQNNLYLRSSGSADVGISLFDVNNTWRGQLYASAAGYGFLNSNWGLWDLQKVSGGKLYLNNQTTYYIDTNEIYYNRVYGVTDIRSPIFYDNNDTAYYVDPASTNDAAVRIRGGAYFGPNTSWSEYLYVGGNGRVGTSATVATTNGNLHLDSKNGSASYLNWYSQGNVYTGTSVNLGLGSDSATQRLHVHGTGLATTDFRAPIFYDSANTAFYLDPASTNTSLQIAGTIEQGNNIARPNIEWQASGASTGMVIFSLPGVTPTNYGMVHMVFDIYEYVSGKTSTVIIAGHNWSGAWYETGCQVIGNFDKTVRLGVKDSKFCVVFGGAASTWTYGTIRLRKIHNGGFYNNIMDLGGPYTAVQTTTESFTAVTADLRQLRTPGTFQADGDIRTPIFYDSNNTAFYVDPASGSSIKRLFVDTTNVDPSEVNGAALGNIYEPTTSWSAPGIAFGSAAGSHGAIGYGSGQMYFATENGSDNTLNSRMTLNTSGTLSVNGDVRTPIFYDSNNTAYYLDPLSTSNLNTVQAVDAFRSDRFEDLAGNFFFREGVTSGVTRHLNLSDSNSDPASISSDVGISWGQRTDNLPYYLIWTSNYNNGINAHSRLRLGWHTGVEIGAAGGYGGTRFFDNSPGIAGAAELMSIGKLDAHVRVVNNLYSKIYYDIDNTSYYADLASTPSIVIAPYAVTGGISSIGASPIEMPLQNAASTNTWYPLTRQRAAHSGGYYTHVVTGLYKQASAGWASGASGWFVAVGGNDNYPTEEWRLTYGGYLTNSLGYVAIGGSARSPIFYDVDNTAYYTDPASTSVLNALTVGGNSVVTYGDATLMYRRGTITTEDWNTFIDGSESGYWQVNNGSGLNKPSAYMYGTMVAWSSGGAAKLQLYAPHNGTESTGIFIRTGWDTDYDPWAEIAVSGKSFTNSVDLRAPIFYDSNNTAYYVDPASTGSAFVTAGLIQSYRGDSVEILRSYNTAASSAAQFHITHNFANSTVGNSRGALDIAGTQTTISGSTRSPIFYDSNDTAYYTDPATGTNLNGTLINNGGTAMTGGWNRNLLLQSTFPVIVFNSNSTKYSGIGVDYSAAAGGFYFWVNSATSDVSGVSASMSINTGNFVTAFGSFRSPIFYDSDNTTYYTDPASTSSLNGLTVAAQITGSIQYVTGGMAPNADNYMNFRVMRNNNSTTVNDGMYIGYGNTNSGLTRLFGGGATTGELIKYAAYTLESGSFRAPIFYDNNNTAFYTDPASTSVLNALTVDGISIRASRMIAMSIIFG